MRGLPEEGSTSKQVEALEPVGQELIENRYFPGKPATRATLMLITRQLPSSICAGGWGGKSPALPRVARSPGRSLLGSKHLLVHARPSASGWSSH